MKAKTIKCIRKYWQYTFCEGKLIMRRRADGKVREYKSIQEFISFYVYEHFGIGSGMSWTQSKNKIRDAKRWEEATKCAPPGTIIA